MAGSIGLGDGTARPQPDEPSRSLGHQPPFWFRYTKRIPVAVDREAMIGLPVTVVSPCQPEGRVQLLGERWQARCTAGAGVGDTLVIEAVEQITLVVSTPGSDPGQDI
jgi:membrane-bound ClpP family serine protease